VYKYYLILINVNSKFFFAVPIQNNTTPSVEIEIIIIKDIKDYLASLGPNLKINNIYANCNSKFGKIIKDNDKPETIKLN
jgi:hypothetical protein